MKTAEEWQKVPGVGVPWIRAIQIDALQAVAERHCDKCERGRPIKFVPDVGWCHPVMRALPPCEAPGVRDMIRELEGE